MKKNEIEISDLEGFHFVNGINAMIQRNHAAKDGFDYSFLRNLLESKKAFSSLMDSVEGKELKYSDLAKNSRTYTTLPKFKREDWEKYVRGEEAVVFEKLSE